MHSPRRLIGVACIPCAALLAGLPPAKATGASLSVEAESRMNVLRGDAKIYRCGPCSGGKLVRWIGFGGSLNMSLVAPKAGRYTLKIAYSNAYTARTGYVRVNFDVPAALSFGPTGGWQIVQLRSMPVHLDAGLNHIAFTNPKGWCPDIDRVIAVR